MTRTLLIVEDNPALSQMLIWSFEDLGYLVMAATCCGTAWQRVCARRPDVVLLDYQLPDGTGLELLKDLHRLYPGLPIFMMSATCDPAVAATAKASGAHGFAHKPVKTSQLEQAFQRALTLPVG